MDLEQHLRNLVASITTDDMDATETTAIRDYQRIIDTAKALQLERIHFARELGNSWEEIGQAAGVSRQVAHQRYAKK